MANSRSRIKKERENFLARITYRKISEPIAVLLSKTPITPNHVSFISITCSLIAGIFFSFGEWKHLAIGYLFLQLTFLMDHVDGNLARYTNKSSAFGNWVDEISNKLHKFFFVIGLSMGVFILTNNYLYLVLGSVAIFNWFFAAYISETKRVFKFKSLFSLAKETKKDYFPFTLLVNNLFGLLILINKPDFALWFISIVSLNAYQQIYSVRRQWVRKNKS